MEPYQMKNLYSAGKFQEIIALWKNEEEREQFTEWDYIYVMNTMYKQQQDYKECLEVYRAFHKKFPESDKLDDRMGWACYQVHIKGFDPKTGDRKALRKQAEYIIAHSSQEQYSPKWFMVKYMLDQIKDGAFGQEISPQQQLECHRQKTKFRHTKFLHLSHNLHHKAIAYRFVRVDDHRHFAIPQRLENAFKAFHIHLHIGDEYFQILGD